MNLCTSNRGEWVSCQPGENAYKVKSKAYDTKKSVNRDIKRIKMNILFFNFFFTIKLAKYCCDASTVRMRIFNRNIKNNRELFTTRLIFFMSSCYSILTDYFRALCISKGRHMYKDPRSNKVIITYLTITLGADIEASVLTHLLRIAQQQRASVRRDWAIPTYWNLFSSSPLRFFTNSNPTCSH